MCGLFKLINYGNCSLWIFDKAVFHKAEDRSKIYLPYLNFYFHTLLQGERAQSLKVYNIRMSVFKNNIIEMRKRR